MATAWDVGNGAGSLISMSLCTDQKKGRQLGFGESFQNPKEIISLDPFLFDYAPEIKLSYFRRLEHF